MRKSTSGAPASKTYKSTSRASAARRSEKVDAELAFLLARQTLLQVEHLARRLRTAPSADLSSLALQSELGAAQLSNVAKRLKALARSRDLSRRFEAEEMLIRVRALEKAMRQSQSRN